MKKRLIIGLGNIGSDYLLTRHNVGFLVLDALASKHNQSFESVKMGSLTRIKIKGRELILLKPNTFMNLSGKSVAFWLNKEKIDINSALVITDDIHLPFGVFRIKPKGSDGGHNGLKHIQEVLSTIEYPRFKFGVGGDFFKGKQIDYVLGQWTISEQQQLHYLLEKAAMAVESFSLSGLPNTMMSFNGNHTLLE